MVQGCIAAVSPQGDFTGHFIYTRSRNCIIIGNTTGSLVIRPSGIISCCECRSEHARFCFSKSARAKRSKDFFVTGILLHEHGSVLEKCFCAGKLLREFFCVYDARAREQFAKNNCCRENFRRSFGKNNSWKYEKNACQDLRHVCVPVAGGLSPVKTSLALGPVGCEASLKISRMAVLPLGKNHGLRRYFKTFRTDSLHAGSNTISTLRSSES